MTTQERDKLTEALRSTEETMRELIAKIVGVEAEMREAIVDGSESTRAASSLVLSHYRQRLDVEKRDRDLIRQWLA